MPAKKEVFIKPIWGLALLLFFAFSTFPNSIASAAEVDKPLVIGLDADMSSASAMAGQSIQRGALIAIHEINGQGGVLGRPLTLETRDHRGSPIRGKDNVEELVKTPDLVAILGGLHTPVALEVLPIINENHVPFLIPWAAGTPIIDNGHSPNYVFRVSVRDAFAGKFLIDTALDAGYRRPGLLLENTGWGRSNLKAMTEAAVAHGLQPPPVQWFNWGVKDLTEGIFALKESEADVILLVANPPEGLVLVDSMVTMSSESRLPIISHWGITGGNFQHLAGSKLTKVELSFLQTFNFTNPPFPKRAEKLFSNYKQLFPEYEKAQDIPAAPGLVHAYDLVYLLAKAITKANSTDTAAIRDALEEVEHYSGIMADYNPPFTKKRHDALGPESFHMYRYDQHGNIIPSSNQ
ncbi:ABC transporter substrate-binding protein [Maridesulfovibrio ferrireducens]|uniref:ABC transporter substrate-binding protein n=1 Tax=Maridesulfovibrio ferrireducens TaxID=246191 RepID=UPI001A2981E0|nr:ABC transporter substrate-binding protein [Maridesulfovibrio ferrireducens]MBI9113303.1 ABC transporter substrate-binding protein [Maridesulfovibrio ferrireducens]